MRLMLDSEQLIFATRGLRMNEKAVSIAEGYFIEGLSKNDLAKKYFCSVSYVSSLITKIELNLKRMLELNDMEIVVYFQPKAHKDTLND